MRRVFVALTIWFLPAAGSAEMLATRTLTTGNGLTGTEHRVRPIFGYDPGGGGVRHVLFDDVWIDSPSVGAVSVETAASDTEFAAVATRLTDGIVDHIALETCEAITCAETGALGGEGAFFGLTTPGLGPAHIEKISLRVDALSFGLAPRGEATINYTFTVTAEGQSGTVPVRTSSRGRLKSNYR